MRKVFLKLNGIKGASQRAGHTGEIEVNSFFWVARAPGNRAGNELLNDLTVIKQPDRTSPLLAFVSTIGESFDGVLTIEDVPARGGAVRSTAYALRSAVVESVAPFTDDQETVTLNCRSITKVCS